MRFNVAELVGRLELNKVSTLGQHDKLTKRGA